MLKKEELPECPVATIVQLIGSKWKLTDRFGIEIPKEDLYTPHYRKNCSLCGSRLICNGCSDCGRCKEY